MKDANKIMIVLFFIGVGNIYAQNDMSDLKKKIQDLDDKQSAAILKGDVSTFADFYTEDAISLPNYEPIMNGKDEILSRNQNDLDSGIKYKSFENKITNVFGNGDLLYEIGTYEIAFTMPDMPGEIRDYGKYIAIWQKQPDGSLKIKTDTWNSDVNPLSMQAVAKQKDVGIMKKGDNDK